MSRSESAVSALVLLLGGPALIAWNRFSYHLYRRHRKGLRSAGEEGRIYRGMWVFAGDAIGAVCILLGLIYLFLAITDRQSLSGT